MLKLILLGVVVFLASAGAGLAQQRWKAMKVRRARLELATMPAPGALTEEEARLQPGFDDRPLCPRGHGHMERFGSLGWWCTDCSFGKGTSGGYTKKCRCGWWIPDDWTGCLKCGRKRPRSLF